MQRRRSLYVVLGSVVLASGAFLAWKSRTGDQSFMRAARSNDIETAKQLFLEADFQEKGGDLFYVALDDPKPELLKELLALDIKESLVKEKLPAETNIVDVMDSLGQTLLYNASKHGLSETVQELVKAGANASIRDRDGNDALRAAVSLGAVRLDAAVKIVQELAKAKGIDQIVNSKAQDGSTSLFLAIGKPTLVQALLSIPGIDVNIPQLRTGPEGSIYMTPLMRASEMGDKESVRLLLGAKADITFKNILGQTALSLATIEEIANLLKAAGAKA